MTDESESQANMEKRSVAGDGAAQLAQALQKVDFFSRFWEKERLHLERALKDSEVENVMSLEYFDELFSSGGIMAPHLDIVTKGKKHQAPLLMSPSPSTDLRHVFAQLDRGSTIRLPHVEVHVPSVGQFCRVFEHAVGMPIRANLYMTPPFSQGFRPHYDLDDIFVLQVFGSKTWSLHPEYSGQVPLPNRDQAFSERAHLSQSTPEEVVLEKGDVLYLPRGCMHEARTESAMSIHITFAVIGMSRAEVLHKMVDLVALEDERFRGRVPVPLDSSIAPDVDAESESLSLHQEIGKMLEAIDDNQLVDGVLKKMRQTLRAHRNPPMKGEMLRRIQGKDS